MEMIMRALIGVVIALVGYVASKAIEYRGLYTMPKPRREELNGLWVGTVSQHIIPEGIPSEYKVDIHFSTFWKFVIGNAFFDINNKKTHLSLLGGFYDNHILRLNYRNKKLGIIHYGLLLLDFSSGANQLKGSFLGYGYVSEQIVTGEIDLIKKT